MKVYTSILAVAALLFFGISQGVDAAKNITSFDSTQPAALAVMTIP